MATGFCGTTRFPVCTVHGCDQIEWDEHLCECHYYFRIRKFGVAITDRQIELIDFMWRRGCDGDDVCAVVDVKPDVVWLVLFDMPWPGDREAAAWGWTISS